MENIEVDKTTHDIPLIFQALINCTKDIGLVGISKDSTNSYQRFNYRSIDGCLAAFNKVFAKNGICTIQRTLNTVFENLGKDSKGGLIWGVTFDLEVTFYAKDGSHLTSIICIANDGKDRSKLIGQATSYALKELLFKQFVVPTEGADDIDARNEVEGRSGFPTMPNRLIEDTSPQPHAKPTNQRGVAWVRPDLSLGIEAAVSWAAAMTGKSESEMKSLLDSVKPDANGKKGSNFLAHVEAMWAAS